jgi:hypothetical protein
MSRAEIPQYAWAYRKFVDITTHLRQEARSRYRRVFVSRLTDSSRGTLRDLSPTAQSARRWLTP